MKGEEKHKEASYRYKTDGPSKGKGVINEKPQVEIVETNSSNSSPQGDKEGDGSGSNSPHFVKENKINHNKIRLPSGGKNPQVPQKSKGITQVVREKGIGPNGRKEKNSKAPSSSTGNLSKKEGAGCISEKNKENTVPTLDPKDSGSLSVSQRKLAEEEAVLAYMRSMHMIHGEKFLEKFRSEESKRNALSKVDNNDLYRAEVIRNKAILMGKDVNGEGISSGTGLDTNCLIQDDPMDAMSNDTMKEVGPSNQHTSL